MDREQRDSQPAPDERDVLDAETKAERDTAETNPPRTTTGKMTSPKFGSATSGGGEFEPGPEKN